MRRLTNYADTEIKGFILRVSANGSRSFIVRGTVNSKQKRVVIGHASDMTALDELEAEMNASGSSRYSPIPFDLIRCLCPKWPF